MANIFYRAIEFAMKAHEGQKRKDGSVYLLHPLEDAAIVGTMTNDLEILAAAVLHDTVEDTDTTAEDILREFGERVAELVAHETEDKRPEMDAAESWKIRKEESLAVLRTSGVETKMLWLGDKLSNMRALSRDYDVIGIKVFDRFNEKDPRKQRWYHSKVLEYTSELCGFAAYKEYKELFDRVFKDYE